VTNLLEEVAPKVPAAVVPAVSVVGRGLGDETVANNIELTLIPREAITEPRLRNSKMN